MLHGEEWFPEAADFKGLVKSHVVCHAGMHFGGGTGRWGARGSRRREDGGGLGGGEARQAPEIA